MFYQLCFFRFKKSNIKKKIKNSNSANMTNTKQHKVHNFSGHNSSKNQIVITCNINHTLNYLNDETKHMHDEN